jgi:hypothetical protein
MKRSERRHHEARVKERKRPIAKRWAGEVGQWVNKLKVTWSGRGTGTVTIHREKWIDRRGAVERMKFIERTINRLAHHNKCPCGMCKRGRYNRKTDAPPIELD